LSPCLCVPSAARGRRALPSFPTRRSSDLALTPQFEGAKRGRTLILDGDGLCYVVAATVKTLPTAIRHFQQRVLELMFLTRSEDRSEEHTSELQSREKLVCRLLLEKKKPGVSTVGEGSGGFHVRGGAANQNLMLLDEVPVYNK